MPQTKTSQINAKKARERAAELIRKGKALEAAQNKQAAPKPRQKVPEPIFDEAELSSSSSSESEQEEVPSAPEPVPQPLPQPVRTSAKKNPNRKKKYDEIDSKLENLSKTMLQLNEQLQKQQQQQQPAPQQRLGIHDLLSKAPLVLH